MAENVLEAADRLIEARHEGRRRAREAVLEALAEVDLPADARARLLAVLRERKVV
jgi:hypothetical protein